MQNETETTVKSEKSGPDVKYTSIFLRGWYPYFWVGLIALFIYAKTIVFNFTYCDDSIIILDNYWFLARLENIFKCFLKNVFLIGDDVFYRPLLIVSFILNAQAGGMSPFVYHLTNVLIHSCCSVLVCALLIKMGYGRLKALMLSLLFAVHPALSQAVAWIPGRNDSLLALFALPAFLFLMNYAEHGRLRDLAGHAVFLCLAFFTKETAYVIIPIGAVYLWIAGRHKAMRTGFAVLAAAWAVPLGLYTAMKHLSGIVLPALSLPVLEAFFRELLPGLLIYFGKAVFPFNLSVMPAIRDTTLIYGLLALVPLAAAVLLTPKARLKYSLFGLAWFVLFLAPTFMFTQGMQFEHRLYLPIIGLLVAAAEVDWRRACPDKRLMTIASAVIITVFSVVSFVHSDIFIGRIIFWESAVKSSPRSAIAHCFLGMQYQESGKYDLSEKHLKMAAELDPAYWAARSHLAVLFMRKGDYAKAEQELIAADRLRPGYHGIYFNRGMLYGKQGRYEEAVRQWERAIELDPDYLLAYQRLALYYQMTGDITNRSRYAALMKEKFGYDIGISTAVVKR